MGVVGVVGDDEDGEGEDAASRGEGSQEGGCNIVIVSPQRAQRMSVYMLTDPLMMQTIRSSAVRATDIPDHTLTLTASPSSSTTTMLVVDTPAAALPPTPDAVVDLLRDLVQSSYLNHDVPNIHIRAGALFARLKALNRAANAATRTHKQATADARHDMDQTHLGLQNFLYEKRHLEREIEKCRQFA